jgi:hypothetical protein
LHHVRADVLGRSIKSPRIKRAEQKSKVKIAHIIQVKHRDEVEEPLTDWLREAYEFEPVAKTIKVARKPQPAKTTVKTTAKKAVKKKAKAKRK